jgi:hypothetical protein
MRKQHGDLVLEKVSAIPTGAKKIKISKGFIVERGEGTNTHTLLETEGVEAYEKDGVLYLKVDKKVNLLDHEEHGVQTYEPGIYRKGIELEYDAEADEARRTQD